MQNYPTGLGEFAVNNPQDELGAVTARAKRRFPDYTVDVAFPVCLPVYELRLTVTVIDEHRLSTTALFILRLLRVGISQPAELGKLLGISDGYVTGAAAELLSANLIRQRLDQRIEMTDQGRNVLSDGGKSLRPRNRSIRVPYDHLTKKVIDIDIYRLLDRDYVRKDGAFIVPARPRKPRQGNIRIAEVRNYARGTISKETEVFDVSALKDAKLRYRADVILVKMAAPNATTPTFAAYRAQQYLEEETASIQRLADNGADLVPEEWKAESTVSWPGSLAASKEETDLLTTIEELNHVSSEKAQAAKEAELIQGDTLNAQERADLAARVERLEAEKSNLESALAEREGELHVLTRGEFRLIKTEEHRHLLLQAIDKASLELTLVSPWIDSYAFDGEVCRRLVAAIGRGATVRIAWGMGVNRQYRQDGQRNKIKGEKALAELKKLIPQDRKKQLIIKVAETHEKFIICDDLFCAWGSHNWLSYRGERDSGYRRETSSYSERPSDIDLWKANAATLFDN